MRIYCLYVRTIHSILSEEMEISMNDIIYKVIDIEEPDFGCEGLPDGEQIMDIVTLQESEGVTDIRLKISDAYLYLEEIDKHQSLL